MPHFLSFEKHKHDLPVHCPDSPPAHYFLVKAVTQMCTMLHFVFVFHNEFVSLAFGKNLKVRFIIAISSPFHPPHFLMFLLSHYPQVYSQTWFIKASLLPLNYPPVDSGKHLY